MTGDDWLNNGSTRDRFRRYLESELDSEVNANCERVQKEAEAGLAVKVQPRGARRRRLRPGAFQPPRLLRAQRAHAVLAIDSQGKGSGRPGECSPKCTPSGVRSATSTSYNFV